MTSITPINREQKNTSVGKDITEKKLLTYRANPRVVAIFNYVQMALSEAYINGLEVPDSIVRSILDTCLPILYKHFPSLLIPYDWVLEESEKLAEGSQELMRIQYDLPTDLFRIMLGEGELIYPKYTMALWEKGASSLEQAQTDMLADVIEKAGIQDGDEILDLGCGWGSASHYILSQFPHAKVTALNLSHEQCEYMRQKMQDPKSHFSSGRFTVYETDFNDINFDKKFDKILAIGLFEHIGNLSKSFQKLASILKENGQVFIHFISIRFPHNAYSPFLNKYIFPNVRIRHYDAVPLCNQDLQTINRWYLNGANYSKTLKVWLKNFDENQEKIKTLDYGIDYVKFRRIWRLYLLWCMAYFDSCDGTILGNAQYLMTHA